LIIGSLAAIAIPKFAATKDKSILDTVKPSMCDGRSASEACSSDYSAYGTFAQLQSASNFTLSSGNTAAIVGATNGYTATMTNASDRKSVVKGNGEVGGGARSTEDEGSVGS